MAGLKLRWKAEIPRTNRASTSEWLLVPFAGAELVGLDGLEPGPMPLQALGFEPGLDFVFLGKNGPGQVYPVRGRSLRQREGESANSTET